MYVIDRARQVQLFLNNLVHSTDKYLVRKNTCASFRFLQIYKKKKMHNIINTMFI